MATKPKKNVTYTFSDQTAYTGKWKDKEAIHGRGKLEWRNGDLLDSWFSKGEIAGVVTTGLCCFTKTAPCLHTYTFANGSEYTGLITGGSMAGAGNLRASYTISDTDRNGKGLPEGYASYSGDVFDGLYSGRGELAFQNGDKYAGMFAGNTMSGQGTYSYANGDTYVGTFKQGRRHGKGKFTHTAAGDTYTGDFKDGAMHGTGTYSYEQGEAFKGRFENNCMISGTWMVPSGHVYGPDHVLKSVAQPGDKPIPSHPICADGADCNHAANSSTANNVSSTSTATAMAMATATAGGDGGTGATVKTEKKKKKRKKKENEFSGFSAAGPGLVVTNPGLAL